MCGGGVGCALVCRPPRPRPHWPGTSPQSVVTTGHWSGRWCGGGRPRAQPSHQQVGLHHSTPPPPSGAPAPSPAPSHHLATPPPRLVTHCHACPCHHWPGHVETLHQTYAYLAMLAISNKFTTFIISYFLPKSVHASKAPRSPAPDRVLSTLSLISINDQFLFRHE